MRILTAILALVCATSLSAQEKLVVSCEDMSFAEPHEDGDVLWTIVPGLRVDIFRDTATGAHWATATLGGNEGKDKKWPIPAEPLSKLQALTFLDETRIMHDVNAKKVTGGTKYRLRDGKWGGTALITIEDRRGTILMRFFTTGLVIAKCGR